jgi:hypothetical protein
LTVGERCDLRLVRSIAWFYHAFREAIAVRQTEKRTYTRDVVTAVHCDICGAKGYEGGWPEKDGGGFEVNQTTVRFKTGKQYPDCGSGVEYEVDICPACFKDRLMPWLNSQGATVRQTEWETG